MSLSKNIKELAEMYALGCIDTPTALSVCPEIEDCYEEFITYSENFYRGYEEYLKKMKHE